MISQLYFGNFLSLTFINYRVSKLEAIISLYKY